MSLFKLNEKYYYLFNDLFDASPALPERHYATVAKVLEQQYLEELDICLTELALSTGVKNFELKFKARNYLPRRVWLRWNKMAKALLNEYKVELKSFFDNFAATKKSQHEVIEDVTEEVSSETESTSLTIGEQNTIAPQGDNNDEKNA